ncbi:hypothetical protein BST23_11045 [Mycolicibacterium elephantis]|uniref:FUSC family protein n=1 Tax=Mycolicibacterium elephantis TaxID=81858 RepID=A0A1X0D1G6_9MYCO|nr:hypothetical protein [Mycolicibacterium elephantis]ORA66237.1 hypothetical protein BST23_11045 [Mycolicibacterium elephantis]
MTGSEDSSSTRPISVAELLARNGTIGAPPIGGRRRRRRGSADSITVAELTGEIPIVRPDTVDTAETAPADTETVDTNGAVDRDAETETAPETDEAQVEALEEEAPAEVDEVATEDVAEATDVTEVDEVTAEAEAIEDEDVDDDYAGAVADYSAYIEHREKDSDLDFFAPPRRSPGTSRPTSTAAVDAEQMSPDPLIGWADAPAEDDTDVAELDKAAEDADDELPSYLRSGDDTLFGGPTVDDDLTRRDTRLGPEDIDLEDHDEDADTAAPSRMSSILRAAWVVGQCIVAVAFGAGLFIAFDQLWKWNNIVALVLSVLVILGLVVGVRVVRKTEDIGSTLIAVAVGALVTLGPLALLQSG